MLVLLTSFKMHSRKCTQFTKVTVTSSVRINIVYLIYSHVHCTAHINQEIKTFLVSKKRIPHPDDICNAVKQSNLISIDNQHILAHFSITCKQVK